MSWRSSDVDSYDFFKDYKVEVSNGSYEVIGDGEASVESHVTSQNLH